MQPYLLTYINAHISPHITIPLPRYWVCLSISFQVLSKYYFYKIFHRASYAITANNSWLAIQCPGSYFSLSSEREGRLPTKGSIFLWSQISFIIYIHSFCFVSSYSFYIMCCLYSQIRGQSPSILIFFSCYEDWDQ